MTRQEVIHVIDDEGWRLLHRGTSFGPYPSEQDAISTARLWALNAERQGHAVRVVIHNGEMPRQSSNDGATA